MIAHLVVPAAPPAVPPTADARSLDDDFAPDAGVRPFIVTQGRTVPADRRLRIETQVLAFPGAARAELNFEHRRIVELCQTSLSIAELAAALLLPFGVARVLVADLAEVGAVTVQQSDDVVSRAALERILEHVNAL